MEHLKKSHFIKRKRSKTHAPKQTRQKVPNLVSRPVLKAIQNKFCGLSHPTRSFCNLWQKNVRKL